MEVVGRADADNKSGSCDSFGCDDMDLIRSGFANNEEEMNSFAKSERNVTIDCGRWDQDQLSFPANLHASHLFQWLLRCFSPR